ncbi:hypothetical protein A3L11_01750 [Thermococcus siculi]|uniref:Uncharacterized protein n=1 Tax=Thermococcus siculi TaxID=72803 RepID=A0A2Z2MN19_9EURY|nr:hypothetical protein [Thermococcus siculi]ASJ08017.1 hypothetical protein A3L11_01750 [Thermococcus siculi]
MRRLAVVLLFLLATLLLPPVSPGYLGAEDIKPDVLVTYGSSALISVEYTPYSPSQGGSLVPSGFCCLHLNFYVNESGAYFLDESWDEPLVYWHRDFYYVFVPTVKGTVEVYRLGEGCFERLMVVKPSTTEPNFAVAVPYLVAQVSKDELVAFNVAKNVSVGRFDLSDVEDRAYFKGVTIVKENGRVRLVGDEPENPPSYERVGVRDGLLDAGGDVEIPIDELNPYLWTSEEVGYLRAYRLGNGVLLVPPAVKHFFAPDANSTGELLIFGNESVPARGVSNLYIFYYDGKLKAFKLGEPTGSSFMPSDEQPRFKSCPSTHPATMWIGIGLLLLLGILWWLAGRE